MKRSCLMAIIFLLILGVYQSASQMNWDRNVALVTSIRRNQWVRNEKLSPLTYEVQRGEETRLCHRGSERITELVLLNNGRFSLKTLDNKGKQDLKSRSFGGYYSINQGEIYYAEEHQFHGGSILMLNSDLTPKVISFGRTLLSIADCKNFAL